MMIKSILAVAATGLLAFGAQAAVVYTDLPVSPVQPVPGSLAANFSAGAGAGSVSFDINGYLTLDGANCCTDTFTLVLNGTDIFSGAFALGGGGANVIILAPPKGLATRAGRCRMSSSTATRRRSVVSPNLPTGRC